MTLQKIGALITHGDESSRPRPRRQSRSQHLVKGKPLAFVSGGVDVCQILGRNFQLAHLRYGPG
jgi:hypothetical protein